MNTHYIKHQVQKGFTLVELLIVVIILAILAAIVVPQFAASTDDARISSLDSTLSNMRSAIDLYRQQHTAYPGELTAIGAPVTCTAGTAAAATATGRNLITFEEQMSKYTNATGEACSLADVDGDGVAEFPFGPYLKKIPLPDNPVSNNPAVVITFTGNLVMAGDGAAGGWKYDTLTGKFIANDTNPDPDGVTYDLH